MSALIRQRPLPKFGPSQTSSNASDKETDRQLPQRSIDRVNGILRECFDYIQQLGDPLLQQAEEDLLVDSRPSTTSKRTLTSRNCQSSLFSPKLSSFSTASKSISRSDSTRLTPSLRAAAVVPCLITRLTTKTEPTANVNPPIHQPSNRPTRRLKPNHSNSQPPINDEDALRVSRIEIPRFSGSAEEWVTFWAALDFAVNFRHYPAFQKHLLLLQYLEKGSPPRRMIELTTRYGDVGNLRDQLNAQLLHLRPARNNLKELRQLQHEIDRICTQLCSLESFRQIRPKSRLHSNERLYPGRALHSSNVVEGVRVAHEPRNGMAERVNVRNISQLSLPRFPV
ncbi:hypothetical protein niasHT_034250 [Heterodera trifolii]|uniref:Uncharacterized protein n=1 Tax=Heterodera trifolii TaxID=157864 RepID=A0ABD2INE6_9BILA